MKRREFIALLGGGAVAWPLAARAQQPAPPVIGFLSPRAPGDAPELIAAFRQGLKDTGFAEGQNVAIEYRFAENHNERLPALAADLVHRQVAVIAATTTPAALAARAATATIPIVFEMGGDAVQLGLVASLNRPGSNITGVTNLSDELLPKRLEVLHELLPNAATAAALINPTNSEAESQSRDLQAAADALRLNLHILHASTEHELEAAFSMLVRLKAGALVIAPDPFLLGRHEQLAALTLRHRIPTVFQYREFAAAGGLMSYGASVTGMYRIVGVYIARILKGEKPADLPVQQATQIELIVNLKTAKALVITVPQLLLGRADEVIE